MNSRLALLALSITFAVFSLALFFTVVEGSASGATDVAIGTRTGALMKASPGNHQFADQRPDIRQDETLSLTEPISIYLPMLDVEYVKYPAERAALMAIYQHTNGYHWKNNTGWGTNSSHCDWFGVTCDENEHVTILDPRGNSLTGTIPSEIGNLPELTVLRLVGTVGCSKYGGCVYSQLSDPLPPEIGNLANLQELALDGNKFSSLPPEIGNLASLQTLFLDHNQLKSLPPEIGNLENLQYLYLYNNQLMSLPPEIGNLENLQYLYLYNNQLLSLPPEIGNLKNLDELQLDFNRIKSLPPEIGNLKNLQGLHLDFNQLSGLIPAFLSNLDNLLGLGLFGNPDLTCWETEEARDWALSLAFYDGPSCIGEKNIFIRIFLPNCFKS